MRWPKKPRLGMDVEAENRTLKSENAALRAALDYAKDVIDGGVEADAAIYFLAEIEKLEKGTNGK